MKPTAEDVLSEEEASAALTEFLRAELGSPGATVTVFKTSVFVAAFNPEEYRAVGDAAVMASAWFALSVHPGFVRRVEKRAVRGFGEPEWFSEIVDKLTGAAWIQEEEAMAAAVGPPPPRIGGVAIGRALLNKALNPFFQEGGNGGGEEP